MTEATTLLYPPRPESSPRVRPCRLGFLGVGWIGRNRMEALARSKHVEIVAVVDVASAAAEVAAREAGAIICRGFEELMDHNLDGVVIATPSALHAAQTTAALNSGLAVFCQKPLGRTTGEVREVIAAAMAADRLLGVDLSYRHLNGIQQIRGRIRSGDLGEIFAADLTFHNAYGPDKAWFYDPTLSGGGCLMDLGTHLVDLGLWALDYPRVDKASGRLFARGETFRSGSRVVEDYAIASLDLETGACARVACSWRLSLGEDARIEVRFHGSKGGVCLCNVNGSFHDFRTELFRGTRREILSEPPEDWGGRAAIDWARRLSHSRSYDPEIESVLNTTAVLDTIYGV